MHKKLLTVCVIIGITILAGFWWLQSSKQPQASLHTEKNVMGHESLPNPTSSHEFVDLTAHDNVTVRMKNMEYIPKHIKVKKGTTVTWINEDDMEHNAMREHDESETPHGAVEHADPGTFEGPMLAKGESYSFTFNEASGNPYHCAPHPWMKGNVEVVE